MRRPNRPRDQPILKGMNGEGGRLFSRAWREGEREGSRCVQVLEKLYLPVFDRMEFVITLYRQSWLSDFSFLFFFSRRGREGEERKGEGEVSFLSPGGKKKLLFFCTVARSVSLIAFARRGK